MKWNCSAVFGLLVAIVHIEALDLHPKLSSRDVSVIMGETGLVDFSLYGNTRHEVINITFVKQIPTLVFISPIKMKIDASVGQPIDFQWSLKITGLHPGYLEVIGTSVPHIVGFENIFMRITIALNRRLIVLSQIAGWIYFAAWCLSFYPQIYDNFRRKNVTGLNFDYLSLNILGSALYCAFNFGLYACPLIENEYLRRNVRGLNPVLINDVLFSIHALAATLFTAFQCYIYEVLMNYRRRSTSGWSIGCIYLDIIGGVFSILQMLINAYNHDDWASISGDPTKMGLGILSMSFDVLFMLQHYVFYRKPFRTLKENDTNSEELAEEKVALNNK